MREFQWGPAAAAIISTAVVLAIFGPAIANPLDLAWIQGDAITNQFGWHQYQADPAHFYPIVTDRTSYPMPIPVSIFGTIPIIDVVLKLFASFLPAKVQYLGPAFVVGVALQAVLGWAILREATPDRTGTAYKVSLLLGALLFATAPILIVRFYYTHVTLALQWPILWSMLIYLRSFRLGYWRTMRDFSLVTFIAASINPYTMMMVLLVYGAFIARSIFLRSLEWQQYILLSLPLAAGIAALLIFGYVDLHGSGVFGADGFGFYSANFFAPVDPGYKYFSSQFIADPHIAGPGQFEGFGYLGVGAIFILAAAAIVSLANRQSSAGRAGKIYWPLFVVVLVSYVWAMSNKMAFGTHMVTVPIPSAALAFLQTFQSSGRFIWVVDYALMFIGITVLLRQLKPEHAALVLSLAALMQVADLAGPYVLVHRHFADRFLSKDFVERFTDPAYQGLGRVHDTLVVLPPWQCRGWGVPEPDYPNSAFMKFENLAMDEDLRTNSFYSGKLPVAQAFYHCDKFPGRLLASPADKRTAYVLTPRAFGLYGEHIALTHSCDFAQDLFICRGDGKAAGLSDRARRRLLQPHSDPGPDKVASEIRQ